MEEEIKADDPKPFKMAKSVFQSCMDRRTIEENGLEPLKVILRKMGGWPLLEGEKWQEEGYTW